MPSATKAWDLAKIPMTICTKVNTRLTTTLTSVVFFAAAERSRGVNS